MQIEGRNTIIEALRARTNLRRIDLDKSARPDQKINLIRKLAKRNGVSLRMVSKKALNKVTKTQSHQGVIGFGTSNSGTSFSTLIKDSKAFVIYIREALYEYNIGAIIRTAECAGVSGVILPPNISVSPQIRRSSMGATEHIPIVNHSLFQAIKEAKTEGVQVVGIERDKKSQRLFKAHLNRPAMLIIGGEDRPLSDSILEKCDTIVEIPLKGKVNSLNMSVAAGLAIYEVVRQNS